MCIRSHSKVGMVAFISWQSRDTALKKLHLYAFLFIHNHIYTHISYIYIYLYMSEMNWAKLTPFLFGHVWTSCNAELGFLRFSALYRVTTLVLLSSLIWLGLERWCRHLFWCDENPAGCVEDFCTDLNCIGLWDNSKACTSVAGSHEGPRPWTLKLTLLVARIESECVAY